MLRDGSEEYENIRGFLGILRHELGTHDHDWPEVSVLFDGILRPSEIDHHGLGGM